MLASGRAPAAAGGELVGRVCACCHVCGDLCREIADFTSQVRQRRADGDPEHTLPASEQVKHLILAAAFIDGRAVGHQRGRRQVSGAAPAQMADRDAHLLQRDPRVEKPPNQTEHHQITEGFYGRFGVLRLERPPLALPSIHDERCRRPATGVAPDVGTIGYVSA